MCFMPSPQENSNLLLQVQSIHVDEESCQQNYGGDPQTSEKRVGISRSQSCVEDRSGMPFELGASSNSEGPQSGWWHYCEKCPNTSLHRKRRRKSGNVWLSPLTNID